MNIKHAKIKIHIYTVALFPGSPRISNGKLGMAWEWGYIVEPSSNNVFLARKFQVWIIMDAKITCSTAFTVQNTFILVRTTLIPRVPTYQEPGYKATLTYRIESQPINTHHYNLARSFFSRWYWDIIWRWRGHHQHWADRPWVVEGYAKAGWILWTLSCKLCRTDSVKRVNCV